MVAKQTHGEKYGYLAAASNRAQALCSRTAERVAVGCGAQILLVEVCQHVLPCCLFTKHHRLACCMLAASHASQSVVVHNQHFYACAWANLLAGQQLCFAVFEQNSTLHLCTHSTNNSNGDDNINIDDDKTVSNNSNDEINY